MTMYRAPGHAELHQQQKSQRDFAKRNMRAAARPGNVDGADLFNAFARKQASRSTFRVSSCPSCGARCRSNDCDYCGGPLDQQEEDQ